MRGTDIGNKEYVTCDMGENQGSSSVLGASAILFTKRGYRLALGFCYLTLVIPKYHNLFLREDEFRMPPVPIPISRNGDSYP